MSETSLHTPVLLQECLEALNIQADGWYVDATFGRGGHSQAILSRLGPQGRLLVLDKDPTAIQTATALAARDPRVWVEHSAFNQLLPLCQTHQWLGRVNGILLDLGVSSPQLDDAERGFSFMHDGPLDMRMDPSRGPSAADWIQHASESDIADAFHLYGEERFSRRLAKAIVTARKEQPIVRTHALAEIIKAAHPAWEQHKHPATRCFQAIRIVVNQELEELKQVLEQAVLVLAPKGRLAVISFHSLEDRIVKQFFHRQEKGEQQQAPRGLPLPQAAPPFQPQLKSVSKKIKAHASEVTRNVRARSALLRVAEKL